MILFKTKKHLNIDKRLHNVRLTTTNIDYPTEDGWEEISEVHLWYDHDCENCPMSWEDRSYEGECNDCGCFFGEDFDVPIWKCMLPKWIKRIARKSKETRNEREVSENQDSLL